MEELFRSANGPVAVDELSDALSLFHQDAKMVCSLVSAAIASKQLNLDAKIESALQDAAEYLEFAPEANGPYYYEPDVDMVEVEGFEFLPIGQQGSLLLKPVDHDTDYLVAEALVRVILSVTTSFSFSVTDSIDRDEVPMGSASVSKPVKLVAKVFVTLYGDLAHAPNVDSVEAEFERRSYHIDYGEVEPDWGYEE